MVGHSLHTIPTAVSHQSQTLVHEKRPYLRPVLHHTPVLRTYDNSLLHGIGAVDTSLLHGLSPYSFYNGLYNDWNPWYLK